MRSLRTGLLIVALGLVASLGAIGQQERSDSLVEARVPSRAVDNKEGDHTTSSAAQTSVAKLDIDASLLVRTPREGAIEDLFASRNWRPAPPMPAPVAAIRPIVAPPPPAPTAPPLPFRYIGRLLDGDKNVVFIASDQETLSVSTGDAAGTLYRVEAIDEASVQFTYLPLGTRQTLTIPASK